MNPAPALLAPTSITQPRSEESKFLKQMKSSKVNFTTKFMAQGLIETGENDLSCTYEELMWW